MNKVGLSVLTLAVIVMVAVISAFAGIRACAMESFLEQGMVSERQFREDMRLLPEDLPMNRCCPVRVDVRPAAMAADVGRCATLSLDGEWRLSRKGLDPVPCAVPGSVQTALMKAGVIPDPNVGTNAILGRLQVTEHDWICRREFDWPGTAADERDTLVFRGVCDRCVVRVNGTPVGRHQGMFGGPEIDVTPFLVKGRNTVEVTLRRAAGAWSTVVFTNSYGWHYSQLVPLGIWQSVEIRRTFGAEMEPPFVATRDASRASCRFT